MPNWNGSRNGDATDEEKDTDSCPFGGPLAAVHAHGEAREAGASINSVTAAQTFRIDLADNS